MSCRPIGVALVAFAAMLLFAGAASGAPKGVVGSIGAGDFVGYDGPHGVAVDESTGDVYVADQSGHRVRRYDADGTLLSEIGTGEASALKGAFTAPDGLAVDAGGSLWVTESGNARVQRLGPPGPFGMSPFELAIGWDVTDGGGTGFEVCGPADTCKAGVAGAGDGQFGGDVNSFTGAPAVDPVSGDLYVADPANQRIQRFDGATGAFEAVVGGPALFGIGSPARLSTDSTGVLYAVDPGNNRVLRCVPLADTLSCSAFGGSQVSGNSPFAVAVDRTDDRVYVARRVQVPGVWEPRDWPIDVLELDADGDLLERHLAGADVRSDLWPEALPYAGALAVNSATDAVYLSVPHGVADLQRVVILGEPPAAPTAALDLVSGVTTDGATFAGTVNPNGGPTAYRFEYRTGAAPWTPAPAGIADLGSGSDDVPVTQSVTGLEPATTYQVRLVADRIYERADVVTPAQTFTTVAVPPIVDRPRAAADDTTATLEARIDPNNSPTTYHFEYGTDPGYGSTTPSRDAGDGGTGERVVEPLSGLLPGTTYHFRAVATNAGGTTAGPDRTFTTDAAPTSPSGRAFELVTPAGGVADVRAQGGGARPSTPDGNHVCFMSPFAMAGATPLGGTLANDLYCAHRATTGWTTEWVSQPRGRLNPPITAVGAAHRWMSEDGRRKLFVTHIQGLVDERPPVAGDEGFDGYLRDGDTTTWVTPVDLLEPNHPRPAVAASRDLSHVVYNADDRVLEWTPSGARVVSRDENGAPAPGAAALGGADSTDTGNWALPGTISADGSRIVFESTEPLVAADSAAARDVYVREDGAVTKLASPRRGPAGAPDDAFFAGASEDGELVYVQTTAQLTNEPIAGTALYRYMVDADALELVEDGISGTLAVSGDGSTTVFFGTDVLEPAEGLSLYVNRGGQTRRLTPLAPEDAATSVWDVHGKHRVGAFIHVMRALRLTRDGSVIAFRAEADTPGVVGVYRWSVADGLEVISRDANGEKVDAMLGNATGDFAPQYQHNAGRAMSDDGSRVFFETAETLDPRDVNRDVDVYEWRDGRTRLVTPGSAGGADARYLDSSADGSTVFFTTYERILPRQDVNRARDVYAARTGGGFPEPPESDLGKPPGSPAAPPAPGGPVTETGAGGGDQVVDRRRAMRVTRPGKAALARAARTGRLPLRVRLAGGGRVTARATASIRGKRRAVSRASRRIGSSGRATMTLPLSKAARAELRRTGRLRIRVTISAPGVLQAAETTALVRLPRR